MNDFLTMNTTTTLTVWDPRLGYPIKIDYDPIIREGFMYWCGERREVCEIHRTAKGRQIELF